MPAVGTTLKIYLDDMRPAPAGWYLVTGIGLAKALLEQGAVDEASLDHDLGACSACMDGRTIEQWLAAAEGQTMPYCEHVGTGYTLCLWMAETGHWPREKPRVHSMNSVGAERMRGVIDRYFGTKGGETI